MTPSRLLAFAAAITVLGGCATAAKPTETILATADLRSTGGIAAGKATLVAIGGTVELRIAATGLAAGTHGVHLHTAGNCTAPDFASAGGHLNPHARMHGRDNPQGSHLGDLPNLVAGPDGKAASSVPLAGTLADLESQLFDSDGTALVVHAAADDYRTDPSGNSGGRLICGVLTRG